MSPSLSFFKSSWPVFALPLLVILSSVFIVESGMFWQDPQALAFGITYDLVLTSPLLYLFLIRNKPIPKITVITLFIVGLVIASYLLPDDFHFHLNILKTYFLPAVELGVLLFLLIQTRKTIREFKQAPHRQDFLSQLRYAAINTSGSSIIGNVLASELALVYYSLFSWNKTPVPDKNTFSYHRKSGSPALFGVVILLLFVETIALHFIIGLWSPLVAWILTLSSVYAGLQIMAHLKACLQRPVLLAEGKIIVRYGLFGDVDIPFESIANVYEIKNFPAGGKATQLALLKGIEPHNLAIELKEAASLTGVYGIRKNFQTLLLFIDQKETFLDAIKARISKAPL